MNNRIKHLMVGSMLLLGSVACADLDVVNPNAADADRALQTAGDVESLISGAFNTWHGGDRTSGGAGLFLSNASFQHTAPWANFCMEEYARIPRVPMVNETAHGCYGNFSTPWRQSYRALASVADGFRAMENNPDLSAELGATNTKRIQAFGRFIQGLAHAQIAVLYDQGWQIDETIDVTDPGEPLDPAALMEVAMGYLDEAISLAQGGIGTLEYGWMRRDGVDGALLARMAHSMKARYRASAPRSPDQNVDWAKVIADVDAGITEDVVYQPYNSAGWFNGVTYYTQNSGWSEMPYFIWGMADQSGNYHDVWSPLSLADKNANVGGNAMLIVTPDLRFAQGTTVAEQQANPGTKFGSPTNIPSVWAQPGRGTWRWSYYRILQDAHYWQSVAETDLVFIPVQEMRLLKAEGLFETGQAGAAAAIINESRVANGLNATDAAGTNTSCVPRLLDKSCGGLFEMLKWEKRLETLISGPIGVAMYFDSRRWGDLYRGTTLQFPAPCQDMEILQLACETYGGVGGTMSSSGSSYGYPTEG
jgi:hypothetical protein